MDVDVFRQCDFALSFWWQYMYTVSTALDKITLWSTATTEGVVPEQSHHASASRFLRICVARNSQSHCSDCTHDTIKIVYGTINIPAELETRNLSRYNDQTCS
jgi:hypothetical protein